MYDNPSAMEPLLPGRDGDFGDLADLALDLVSGPPAADSPAAAPNT